MISAKQAAQDTRNNVIDRLELTIQVAIDKGHFETQCWIPREVSNLAEITLRSQGFHFKVISSTSNDICYRIMWVEDDT